MNPNAIHLLEANIHKINWGCILENPSLFFKVPESPHKEELVKVRFHPRIFERYLDMELDLNDF